MCIKLPKSIKLPSRVGKHAIQENLNNEARAYYWLGGDDVKLLSFDAGLKLNGIFILPQNFATYGDSSSMFNHGYSIDLSSFSIAIDPILIFTSDANCKISLSNTTRNQRLAFVLPEGKRLYRVSTNDTSAIEKEYLLVAGSNLNKNEVNNSINYSASGVDHFAKSGSNNYFSDLEIVVDNKHSFDKDSCGIVDNREEMAKN